MIAISNLAMNLSLPCHNLLHYGWEIGIYTEIRKPALSNIHKQHGLMDMPPHIIFFPRNRGQVQPVLSYFFFFGLYIVKLCVN